MYHPQSNGVQERLNSKILSCLRSLTNPYSIDWDWLIPTVECALNALIRSAIGESPDYKIFGEDWLLPYELLLVEPLPFCNNDEFISTNINKIRMIHSSVSNHMETDKEDLQTQ